MENFELISPLVEPAKELPLEEESDNSAFSINSFFNNLPIRIIGSLEEPFFYASDVAAVLGIKRVITSVKDFDEMEIVSPEKRKQYNLTTYRKYKDGLRQDDRIILLTEFGVYRLIINSRSELAKSFRNHIYGIIHDSRIQEKEKLTIINQNNIAEIEAKYKSLIGQLDEYKMYCPAIYVFRKYIGQSLVYPHILPDEVDPEFADSEYVSEYSEHLMKYTTKPRPEDYTNYTLFAKLFGSVDEMMGELCRDSLNVNYKANNYCVYRDDDDTLEFNIQYRIKLY